MISPLKQEIDSAAPAPRHSVARPDADLIASLEAAHYHPLWDRYQRITPMAPKANDAPMHWRWRDFEALAARAAKEVPIADVERRAIIAVNPAFGGATTTTSNLIGAFTILNPGDRAPPHRHTASAIRFATRAEGAVTIVNGRRCVMHEGDLVLTPALCWHGHINEGNQRTAWFDAANMPLVCNLDASFFEPGNRGAEEFWNVDEGDERLWAATSLVFAGTGSVPAAASAHAAGAHSPKYRYPGTQTRAMLDAAPAAADGSKLLRYINPGTGGAVMPALDCYAMRLKAGAATRARRATWNMICLVVSGSGSSAIEGNSGQGNGGAKAFDWQQHDVFTIPHWAWASHTAASSDADLFIVTDRSVYELLGLAREEVQ